METVRQVQLFLDPCRPNIDGDGDPDLEFNRIDRSTTKALDLQIELNPFEENFDLPAVLVQLGNGQGQQNEVVGKECQMAILFFVVEADPTQAVRVEPAEPQILLSPDDKEGGPLMQPEEAFGIEVRPVQHIDGAGFDRDLVQLLDVVHPARGDAQKCGDAALEIQQGMHLDDRLCGAEVGPREERQAQIDDGGVEDVGRSIQIQGKATVGVSVAGDPDQLFAKVGENPPVAGLVGFGQGAA